MDVVEVPVQDKLTNEWFCQRPKEETLLPDLEIVDCHHHLWMRANSHYYVDHLIRDISSGHRVTATVYVEAGDYYRKDGPEDLKPVGETEHLLELANKHRRELGGGLSAIVGHADLTTGEAVGPVLDAHVEAGEGRFRGVRVRAQWDPSGYVLGGSAPPGLLSDPIFRTGFDVLARRGLSCDLLHFFHQAPEVADLADAFPDCPIIVNHFGWPIGGGPYEGRLSEVFAEWRLLLPELARRPNIYMKMGGLASPWSGISFSREESPPSSEVLARTWAPYFHRTIETFGPARCMMQSNFPVDRTACTYHTLWNAFKRIGMEYSSSERAQMFAGVAREVYRLATP